MPRIFYGKAAKNKCPVCFSEDIPLQALASKYRTIVRRTSSRGKFVVSFICSHGRRKTVTVFAQAEAAEWCRELFSRGSGKGR